MRSVWKKVWGRERENMKGSGFIYAVAFSIGGVMGTCMHTHVYVYMHACMCFFADAEIHQNCIDLCICGRVATHIYINNTHCIDTCELPCVYTGRRAYKHE